MNENSRRTLYMIAGLYLVYSGGNLTWNAMKENPENETVMLAAGIAFILVGIYFVIDYIRYRKKSFEEQNIEQEELAETIETEVVDSEKEEE